MINVNFNEDILRAMIREAVKSELNTNPPTQVQAKKKTPIGIDEAAIILNQAKSTVYNNVSKRIVPAYKRGKRLYFYEEELLDYIKQGKKTSVSEFLNNHQK